MRATFSQEHGVFALPSMVNGEQGNTERNYGEGFWQPRSPGSYFKMKKKKNIRKLHEWEKAPYSSPGTSRNPELTYSISPLSDLSYCSLPSCCSWRHLGLLVFQCVPVTRVCLKSFFLAYFCSPSSITQTTDLSGKKNLWAAEWHPKIQRPSINLTRKFHLKPTHGYQQARTLERWHAHAHELVITLR